MQRHDVNNLLSDLRHILHSEPGHQSWEALKERLYLEYCQKGALSEVVETYVKDCLAQSWPPQYIPLLDFWIVCVAQEAMSAHAERERMDMRRRVTLNRVKALSETEFK